MLFSELLKVIPKRWMQIFYFEVWGDGHTGYWPFAIEVWTLSGSEGFKHLTDM